MEKRTVFLKLGVILLIPGQIRSKLHGEERRATSSPVDMRQDETKR